MKARGREEYLEAGVKLLLLRRNAGCWQLPAFIQAAICFFCKETWCCWPEEQLYSLIEFMGVCKTFVFIGQRMGGFQCHTGTPARCLQHRAPAQPWANHVTFLSPVFFAVKVVLPFLCERQRIWNCLEINCCRMLRKQKLPASGCKMGRYKCRGE